MLLSYSILTIIFEDNKIYLHSDEKIKSKNDHYDSKKIRPKENVCLKRNYVKDRSIEMLKYLNLFYKNLIIYALNIPTTKDVITI